MTRIIVTLFGAIVLAIAILAMVQDSIVPRSLYSPASVAAAVGPERHRLTHATIEHITLTGTLTYTRNNVGTQIPYLVYQSNGSVATRVLIFNSTSDCVTTRGDYLCSLIANTLATYYPGLVTVSGRIADENLFANNLTYVTP